MIDGAVEDGTRMTGEDGKSGGAGGVTGGTDNANNVNANVNVSQQNGGPEKAPVVGGTNVETLPRAGKQVSVLTRRGRWDFFAFFFFFFLQNRLGLDDPPLDAPAGLFLFALCITFLFRRE